MSFTFRMLLFERILGRLATERHVPSDVVIVDPHPVGIGLRRHVVIHTPHHFLPGPYSILYPLDLPVFRSPLKSGT